MIYPSFFIYHTYHAYILDTSLCLHILLYIEYNHLDMHDMIFTLDPTFSKIYLPLRNYQKRNYHSEEPYL